MNEIQFLELEQSLRPENHGDPEMDTEYSFSKRKAHNLHADDLDILIEVAGWNIALEAIRTHRHDKKRLFNIFKQIEDAVEEAKAGVTDLMLLDSKRESCRRPTEDEDPPDLEQDAIDRDADLDTLQEQGSFEMSQDEKIQEAQEAVVEMVLKGEAHDMRKKIDRQMEDEIQNAVTMRQREIASLTEEISLLERQNEKDIGRLYE